MAMVKYTVRIVVEPDEGVVLGVQVLVMRTARHAMAVEEQNVFLVQVQDEKNVQIAMDMERMHGVINAVGAGDVATLIARHAMAAVLMNAFHVMAQGIKIAHGVGAEDTMIAMFATVLVLLNVNVASGMVNLEQLAPSVKVKVE